MRISPLLIKSSIQDSKVATISPTSKTATKKIINTIDPTKDLNILEYGPGTGALTIPLLKKISPESKILAIERNQRLYNHLSNVEDGRLKLIKGDVLNLPQILRGLNLREEFNIILSGIPFSFLPEAKAEKILEQTEKSLTREGKFIAYQFSPKLKSLLSTKFSSIQESKTLLNIPPLRIYVCQKNPKN
ncbi:hypothetical protein COU62_01195 [Candidatus Pacearchaeota archaeon CG10_big_fil_rev_8_21_14_0_10_35_219]|nr:hypothetical protein [Candidatus Pacearchaeota archaeon]OIO43054.1 MAG: hypothetical protein AUJ63_01365 [Candidatus Pacearchaeota archaeon CG1_02_35_32]PIO08180.1 MAG: hypothetical protein COU62_01195 [Candidatus Pacearchaeota archaeon CG10_big_fil_rev_8_21_14_0_10_35_219]PIY81112.1 MAG: hypothetical protein COY79_04905 [Candidatus Pacearchaeota archaeon CG_4_10_14_0_8_um_filter_35_169]PIZ79761.1 MAG: hypothetical protein COY00_03440 [Candidatus Pacearchaeota archaeon CG_4_10_14_0_2_um_filt